MASVAQPYVQQPDEKREQREDQQKQERRVTRARLVQRLVENAGGDLPDFMRDLIHTQAVVVAGTEAAAFTIDSRDAEGNAELRTVAHVRPDNVEESVKRQAITAFREIVTNCLEKDKDGALRVGHGTNESDPQFCLVTILRQDDRPVAATAVITRCRDESRALQRLSTMQLVAGYFDLFLLKRQHEQSRQVAKTHQDVFQYSSTVATADDFQASTVSLCNELATRAGAARVAIGWVKGARQDRVKLQAMSHTEEFDKKQELSVQLVKVMEECLDQDEFCQFDPAGGSTDNVTREAMKLSQMEGGNRVASLPLRRKDRTVGILTLEFPPEKPAGPAEATALAVAAELLAPQLYDRFQNDRYLVTKAGLSVRDNTRKVFGLRQHTLAKVLIVSAAALLLFLVLFAPMYRVSAPFEFVPLVQRMVDAPYDGQIAEVLVDEGDRVAAGQEIARLDTKQLQLQYDAALKDAQTARAQAAAIRAQIDRGEASLADYNAKNLEAQAAEAQAAFFENQINRATVTAPIDGVILAAPGEGDLKERVGTVVRTGEPLAVVGDPTTLLAEIRVADRDIGDVTLDGPGTIATSARPGEKVPVIVRRVIPAASADAASKTNAFLVVAEPLKHDPNWRPRATGEARLDVENRSLAWQWTHRLVDWVRLKLWI